MPLAQLQHRSLADYMADKARDGDSTVERLGLRPVPYASVAAWPYGDFSFGCDYDVMSDTTKIRQFGFNDAVDSEAMFSSACSSASGANVSSRERAHSCREFVRST
jgi:hypothetical protein